MSTKLNQLRELANKAVKAMRDLHETAEKESRGFSAEERQTFDKARQDYDDLVDRIKRESDIVEQELRMAAHLEGTDDDPSVRAARERGNDRGSEPYDLAFRNYLIGGQSALSNEERSVLVERRDLSLTGAAGGFTVPQGFYNQLTETQRHFGGFWNPNVATEVLTDSGNSIPMPLEDDTGNAAQIVAEGVSLTTSTDSVFTNVTLGAYTYRSLVRVSIELLQDSAFNLEQYLGRKLAIRLGRGFNAHASIGSNTGQPQGVFNATVGASIGATAPTGNTTAFPYLSLVSLEHSLDPGYRQNAQWMFSDGVLQGLKSQVDAQNRPIWMPDYAVAGANAGANPFPATILGYRYVINQDVPAMAANARCIGFGDFSYYMMRRVRGMMLVRASERFIDQGQIGFFLFARLDGKYANPTATAARSPIRLGQNSAT